jgi:hypothetical protein
MARGWLVRGLLLGLVGLLLVSPESFRAAEADEAESRLRRDVTFLASKECEGRGVSTQGINRAADYIRAEFEKAGLKPVSDNPGYYQPFTMNGPSKLQSPNTLTLTGPLGQRIELVLDRDFRPMGLSGAGQVGAPVVFVGYGCAAKGIGYDDYQGVDVAGKIVLMLRRTPRADNAHLPFDGPAAGRHAALQTKVVNADLHKAAAVLLVNDLGSAAAGDTLMPFSYTATASAGKAPAVQIKRSVAEMMLPAGLRLRDLEADIDRDLQPRSFPLEGWRADLQVSVQRTTIPVKNVIGSIEGAGPLAREVVVVGAHYDHLGYGGPGSLAKGSTDIHHGADDNASGTTCLLELARRFGQEAPRLTNRRRLVFIAFSAEESGLLGSDHYCKNPIFPLADTVAMFNLDMVGRLRPDKETQKDRLIVHGTGTAKTFDRVLDELNRKHDFKLQKVASGIGPSDHASFYTRGVPVLFFFTGEHSDYHRPSDTADKINVPGMRKIVGLAEDVLRYLATVEERPQYVKVAGGPTTPMGNVPRIGIRPDYGDDQEGVLLGGVTEGGPAARAGLKEGDRIVEVAGKPVKNLEAYMVLISGHKKGEPLELGIVRDGKKMAVKVMPE